MSVDSGKRDDRRNAADDLVGGRRLAASRALAPASLPALSTRTYVRSLECAVSRQSRKAQLSRVHSEENGIDIATRCSTDGVFLRRDGDG